ncbi:Bug family tripartite tricarboxylate transporter substrate binding protein [Roseomonas gilardii]|uniref:Bug family tripartite tricarboxylate transporter substrate binding protein n=1 Tax=Roseomonas gilardii TaxID=257708 RepID=UPI0004AEDC46|nr:tripartite tricarboxylate transporter substrate-binding protein [Roseomonas gilardii]
MALLPSAGRAQAAWLDRPICVIVPFPPAGGTDVIGHEIAARLGAATGWNLVVDNCPGAGGNIGLDAVAKAAADDHMIGLGQTANLAINPALYPRMPFDPPRDFALVTTLALSPARRRSRRSGSSRCLPQLMTLEGHMEEHPAAATSATTPTRLPYLGTKGTR